MTISRWRWGGADVHAGNDTARNAAANMFRKFTLSFLVSLGATRSGVGDGERAVVARADLDPMAGSAVEIRDPLLGKVLPARVAGLVYLPDALQTLRGDSLVE